MLDESCSEQLQIDFLTGLPTAISRPVLTVAGRSTCAALNRERARGILALSQHTPSGQPVPVDVWTAALTRQSREWQVPLISLGELGFLRGDEGLICPASLIPLAPGAEASPYWHRESGMVYKLFDVKAHGGLGKKITLEQSDAKGYGMRHNDATLMDTMEKIQVLHNLGAHASEIVGLDDEGNFLIVKQPWALPQPYNTPGRPEKDAYRLYETDRTSAIQAIRAEVCRGQELRESVVVGFIDGQAWLIADLHHRNIMRDADGNPTIIDALIGPVSPRAHQLLPWLAEAVANARAWREDRPRTAKAWEDDFNEEEI